MESGEPGGLSSKVMKELTSLSTYKLEQLSSRGSGTVIAASEKQSG